MYPDRALAALNVGRGGNKPRKDFESWKQTCEFTSFYFDETFSVWDEMPVEIIEADRKQFFKMYAESYNHEDDSAAWFDKVKSITGSLGFASKPKDFKKNPEKYKGSIVHITNMIRIALTGRANAPDIWEISHVLGEDLVRTRIAKWQ
jgi:glutamyl-tRNA synthetase